MTVRAMLTCAGLIVALTFTALTSLAQDEALIAIRSNHTVNRALVR